MYKAIKIFAISIAIPLFGTAAFAQGQQPMSPEEQEKQMYEMTQKTVDRFTEDLKLEDWQVFYLDSILTYNNNALMKEIQKLQAAGVSSSDLYTQVQDKWKKTTEEALKKVFNPEQWEKYMKQTGAKQQKAREKKKAKK